MNKYRPLSTEKVKTYPLRSRNNKVNVSEHFATTIQKGMSFAQFLETLPRLLGSQNLLAVADAIIAARANNRPVVLAIGGHVIKCGLQPIIKTLIDADMVTAIAMNGSAAIHDFEISLIGATSEDVGAVLHAGDFGFSEETGCGINRILKKSLGNDVGFAEAIGESIIKNQHPFKHYSLLAACVEKGLPVTAHVALGTDIIHQHPEFDGAVTGEMSARDFRLITSVVADINGGF